MFNKRKTHHTSGFLVSSFRTASSVIRSCLNKTAVWAVADSLNHPSITTTLVWKQRLSVSLLRIQISAIIYYVTIHMSFLGPLQKGKKVSIWSTIPHDHIDLGQTKIPKVYPLPNVVPIYNFRIEYGQYTKSTNIQHTTTGKVTWTKSFQKNQKIKIQVPPVEIKRGWRRSSMSSVRWESKYLMLDHHGTTKQEEWVGRNDASIT